MSTSSLAALPPRRWRSPRAVLQARRLDRLIWLAPLATATFISKLAVPPFGARGISVAIPVICAALAAGLLSERLVVQLPRLMAYLALMALLWLLQLPHGEGFSLPSMVLLSVLHLPYAFQLRRTPDRAQVLAVFQAVALLIGALGLLQYTVQFLLGPALAFPIENFLPPSLRVSAFNMQGNLEYGSTVYRSNGVFMLEPSFFSQLMALGILVEIITRQRRWVMGGLALSLLLSYSGTGVVMLVAGLLFLALAQRRWGLLVGIALGGGLVVALAAAFGNLPYVSVFLTRAGELTSTGSSGFARFVGGFYLFDEFLWPDLGRALGGFGAGAFQHYAQRSDYFVAEMALFKMVFEFGIVGALAYFAFLLHLLARSSAPAVLRVALGLCFLLSGIYIPFAHGLALTLLIWTDRGQPAARTPA